MAIKVLIADDDPLIRSGLEVILKQDKEFSIAGSVSNGQEAVELCSSRKIDIAILDIRMPVKTGIEAAREISEKSDTKCIILSTFNEVKLVRGALDSGARAYILKGKSADEIKNIIKIVASGNTVFQDSVFSSIAASGTEDLPIKDDFTDREWQIMEQIADGASNSQIAENIYLSEGTVKNYISALLSRLNLQHRTQIAVYFLKGKK